MADIPRNIDAHKYMSRIVFQHVLFSLPDKLYVPTVFIDPSTSIQGDMLQKFVQFIHSHHDDVELETESGTSKKPVVLPCIVSSSGVGLDVDACFSTSGITGM